MASLERPDATACVFALEMLATFQRAFANVSKLIYDERINSRHDYKVRDLGVRAAQIDDRGQTFGCDAHDGNVALQIEPPIMWEADVALEKHSKF